MTREAKHRGWRWAIVAFVCFSVVFILRTTSGQPSSEAVSQAAEDSVTAQDDEIDARIMQVEGRVTIFTDASKDDPGADGVPAQIGMPLDVGDHVRTDDQSRAEIGLSGDSVVELGPHSEFIVTSLERSNSLFSLNLGLLMAKVRLLFDSGGRMQVRTPTAVAAVRGTELAVEVEPDGKSHVGVFDEGHVTVTVEGGQEVALGPNEETQVEKGIAPIAPVALRRFIAHRARAKILRIRAEKLRERWKAMPLEQRREIRRKIWNKHMDLRRRIREKRGELRRQGRGEKKPGLRQRIRDRRDRP